MGRRYSRRELEELADASFEVLEDEEFLRNRDHCIREGRRPSN